MATSVLAAVSGLCHELAAHASFAGSRLAAIRTSLGEPLRVAVGGRVSAGKSTLINALLGGRFAPVRAEETAQITTVYRWAGAGEPMRVRLIHDDLVEELRPESDGSVPPVPPEGDAYLEVFLDVTLLRTLELIDTPGLYSADTTGYSDAGRRALSAESARRMAEADAVLFLIGTATSRVEAKTVAELQRMLPADRSGITVVAILNRVDQLHAENLDPFEAGRKVAATIRHDLGAAVGDVVGVSGLLACAALPGGLRDEDLDLIRRLRMAGYARPVDGLFEEEAPAGTEQSRGELLGRLERFGVGWAIDHAWLGPDHFRTELRQRSGITDVERAIHERFQRHAELIKAEHALAQLDALARSTPDLAAAIRAGVSGLRRKSAFHRLAEDRALITLRRVAEFGSGLPAPVRADLAALLLGNSIEERLRLPAPASPSLVEQRLGELNQTLAAATANPGALSGPEIDVVRTAQMTLAILTHQGVT